MRYGMDGTTSPVVQRDKACALLSGSVCVEGCRGGLILLPKGEEEEREEKEGSRS